MGVYIKGMEMPKSCGECAIKSWDGEDDVCPFSGISALSIGRQDDCPLVPVPKHGSLIEKGALLDKCYQHYEDFMYGKIDGKTALLNIEKEIKAAPNIIEAEEGET